jgi:hypothetical protein
MQALSRSRFTILVKSLFLERRSLFAILVKSSRTAKKIACEVLFVPDVPLLG